MTSLIFAAGLIGFSAWPSGSAPSVESVVVPPASAAAPTGAAGRAAAVTLPAAPVLAPATTRRPATRIRARPVARGGSAPAAPSSVTASPTPVSATPVPATPASPPSVTRQVTSGLADTTTAVTHQLGSTVGGPVGSEIASTGDTVAQTLDNVGATAGSLLGG